MIIYIAPQYFAELANLPAPNVVGDYMGIFSPKIVPSTIFPYTNRCAECAGSGEGLASTYCPTCRGAGEIKTIGTAFDGDRMASVIRGHLPKRFAPYFPAGLVRPPRMCRGLA